MKPYIVRPDGPGKAFVIDRTNGVQVGWVVADFFGNWTPFVASTQSALAISNRIRTMVGNPTRYRTDAADAVWEATR